MERGMGNPDQRAAILAALQERLGSAGAASKRSPGIIRRRTKAPVRLISGPSLEHAPEQLGGPEHASNISPESGQGDDREAEQPEQQTSPDALEQEAGRLGEDLHALRTSAKISRGQLARQLGWPTSRVRRIERGERLAEPDEVAAWVRTTGAPDGIARELVDRATRQESLAEQEMSALVQGTVKAFFQHFVDVALTAHHLGLAIKVIKWAHRAWQWWQVLGGEGNLEIDASIPLGPGVELDLSVDAGGSQDSSQPPLAFCFAPSGDSAVGVLTFGPFQVSPAADHEVHTDNSVQPRTHCPELKQTQQHLVDHPQGAFKATVQRQGSVVVINQDLSDVLQVDGSKERVARLHDWAENTLAPELAQNSWLRLTNVGLVVVYDADTAIAVWIHLRASDHPPSRVTIRPTTLRDGTAKITVTTDED
jgi:hypothetical protein